MILTRRHIIWVWTGNNYLFCIIYLDTKTNAVEIEIFLKNLTTEYSGNKV